MRAKFRRCIIAAAFSIVVVGDWIGLSTDAHAAQGAGDIGKATVKLFESVHANDFAGVQASIAAGADVEAVDGWGMTPVELAVDQGYYRIAHFLVSVRNSHRSEVRQQPAAPAVSATSPAEATGGALPSTPPRAQKAFPVAGSFESAADPSDSAMAAASATLRPNSGKSYVPAWPEGKPNPFDPSVPAPGVSLNTTGEIR